MNNFISGVLIFLLILIIIKLILNKFDLSLFSRGKNTGSLSYLDYETNWKKMTPAERMQWIINNNHGELDAKQKETKKIIEENIFINTLNWSDKGCSDSFGSCSTWADNGECKINPEYMLYFCPKSCKACKLNPRQKYKLTEMWNSKMPEHCVYHGKPYPSNFIDLSHLYFSNY